MLVMENDSSKHLTRELSAGNFPDSNQKKGGESFNDYSGTVEKLFGSHRLAEGYLKSLDPNLL